MTGAKSPEQRPCKKRYIRVRYYHISFLCCVMLRRLIKNGQSKGYDFMKKLIVSAMAAIFILGTLSAQEEQKEAKSKVKYSTNINFVANWPLEARLTVTETIKVPVLNFDNPFMRGNNIAFKLGAAVTPVTLEGKFDIVWTPIAFLEVYGGASIGSGWSIKLLGRNIHGLALNLNNGGETLKKPVNFTKAFYTANFGTALQFDLGAIIPTDWTHVIFRTDQYFLYRGVTGVGASDSWVIMDDYGENRNGFSYYGTYLIGYQLPLPMNMIAFRLETKKTFFSTSGILDKSVWGEDRFDVVFGPIISFKPIDQLSILLIVQFENIHAYTNGTKDDTKFYQTRIIDKSKGDTIRFKRVGVILDFTLPNN